MATKNEIEIAARASMTKAMQQGGKIATLSADELLPVLELWRPKIAAVVPRSITAEWMIHTAHELVQQNPGLQRCTITSMLGALMQASLLGFRPVAAFGECYFVPYARNWKDADGQWHTVYEVQLQIGYQGYVTLAYKSKIIADIMAHAVYDGDDFMVAYGTHLDIKHIPQFSSKDATHYYAVAHTTRGGLLATVMTREDVEKLRMRSPQQVTYEGKGANRKKVVVEELKGPWATDYDAMAKGKAIRALRPFLPKDDVFAEAMALDERVFHLDAFRRDEDGNTEVIADRAVHPNAKDAEFTDVDETKPAAKQQPKPAAKTTKAPPAKAAKPAAKQQKAAAKPAAKTAKPQTDDDDAADMSEAYGSLAGSLSALDRSARPALMEWKRKHDKEIAALDAADRAALLKLFASRLNAAPAGDA